MLFAFHFLYVLLFGTVERYPSVPTDRQPEGEAEPLYISPPETEHRAGESIDINCQSSERGVITSWSKPSSWLPNNAQNSGGILRIINLRPENSGIYRCEATGRRGVYHKDYSLQVMAEEFKDQSPIQIKVAPRGSSMRLECNTNLTEPITYTWSKEGGSLPTSIDIYSKNIVLNDLGSIDAATYTCTASSGATSIDVPIIVVVTGIVPYFTQAPNSYITLPTFRDSYVKFSFEISFKPKNENGLILYNGNKGNDKTGDFISLALVNLAPEFKFNLGNSTTTVKSDRPITNREWHTIKVVRNKKKVIMFVDGNGPYIRFADGKYLGLDLTEPLYLGGVPNGRNISPDVFPYSPYVGFVGCISRFKIGHSRLDILSEALYKTGTTTCETCSENKCENQGVCQEALTKEGYSCICPSGFSGPTCNKLKGEACSPYACGVGRCIDTENSFECQCPLGRAGSRCEREITINEPAFHNDAFIAYPTMKPARGHKFTMKVKPTGIEDGILLYSSETEEGYGDFISIAIREKHLEFRFDAGNGVTVIRDKEELVPGQWHNITALRDISDGRLTVDAKTLMERGYHKMLNLRTSLYIGGFDKHTIIVNDGVKVVSGFDGCISDINVSGLDINMIMNATDSSNIEDCNTENNEGDIDNNVSREDQAIRSYNDSRQTGCSSNPCQNQGECYPLTPTEYRCSCPSGFTGKSCEISQDICEQRPCQNQGICRGNNTHFVCDCLLGHTGVNCEQRIELQNDAHFDGNGFLEFNRDLLDHANQNRQEVIATSGKDGISQVDIALAAPPRITLIPPNQVVHPGQNAFINCTTTGEQPITIDWLPIGRNMPSSVYTQDGYIRFNNIQLQDAGRYLCRARNNAGEAEATADVIIKGPNECEPNEFQCSNKKCILKTWRCDSDDDCGDWSDEANCATNPPGSLCAFHQFACHSNNQCIPRRYHCDMERDCVDGSDEVGCCPNECEPNEFQCSNKKCILKTWRCDSDDDCGDWSDEANCATNPPGSLCAFHQFACHSNNQCIPRRYHCDMERDCVDGSDEVGCSGRDYSTPRPDPSPTTKPSIDVTIEDHSIGIYEVGSTVRYNCLARSQLAPRLIRVKWNKANGQLPSRAIDDGRGLLVITNVRVTDAGRYICEASDGYSIVTRSVDLTVGVREDERPSVVVSQPYIEVTEHQPVKVTCATAGVPTPELTILRLDGQRLNPLTDGVFRISRTQMSDSGDYECIASNRAGTESEKFKIVVRPANGDILKVDIEPTYYTGERVVLRCITTANTQGIVWSKEGGILPYDSREDRGMLIITNSRPQDSGVYVCSVTSLTGSTGSSRVTVTITDGQSQQRNPEVKVSPERITISQGQSTELQCTATGYPAPTVKWTKLGEELRKNIEQIGSTLSIRNAQVEDRGMYVCVATNQNGTELASVVVEVTRLEMPQLEIYPQLSQTVVAGESTVVQCRAIAGIPTPTIVWRREDGLPLGQKVEEMSGGTLRFIDISRNEEGRYICTGKNEAGTTTATLNIIVHTQPEIHITPERDIITRNVGDSLVLECRGSGIPEPNVYFSKYVTKYESRIPSTAVQNIATQQFNSLQTDDAGLYICRAESSAGIAEKRVQLVVDCVPTRGDITGKKRTNIDKSVPELGFQLLWQTFRTSP